MPEQSDARIEPVQDDVAGVREAAIFERARRRYGWVPNTIRVMRHRGSMPDEELDAARLAGLQQSTLLDIVAVVAENNLGNYINNLARTPVDPVPMDAAERIEMGAAGVAQ